MSWLTPLRPLAGGGTFGYRFLYPAMRVGPARSLLAAAAGRLAFAGWRSTEHLLPDAPLGYLTAYRADRPRPERPIELWPRLLQRGPHEAAVEVFDHEHDQHYRRTSINVRKLLDAWQHARRTARWPKSFARQLLTLPGTKNRWTIGWPALPGRTSRPLRAGNWQMN